MAIGQPTPPTPGPPNLVPGVGPSPMPMMPGGAPKPPGMAGGLGALAGMGQGGMPPAQLAMLIFLAGIGWPEFTRLQTKAREGPKTPGGKQAAGNAQQTNPAAMAQLAQLIAARRQAGAPPPSAMMPGAMPPMG